jgi:arylsulfatase A
MNDWTRQANRCCIGLVAVATLGLAGAPRSAAAESPPNVIIIYTDDQGTLDLGVYGSTDLVTPHQDALAESGVRFTQFYAAPVCTPSRVGLLTGKSTQRAGVPDTLPAVPGQTAGLDPSQFTLVDLFGDAGYATAHMGKWHLGFAKDKQPLAHGFDHTFGHIGGCIDNYSHFYYWRGPNRHDLNRNGEAVYYPGEYFPDLMLRETKEFIDLHRDQPFFVYFALNTPHYPYQGNPKWLAHYHEQGVPYPRNLYAAALSTQDDIIGRLIAHLEALGLRERTIVIFQSDNGHSTEERAHSGGGNAGPYRGAKASLFEGGIRVPAAISWPGRLPAGAVRGQVAANSDWLPTLAELCDLSLPDEEREGKSLVPLIDDDSAPSPHADGFCWEFRKQWVARKGAWKLHGNPMDTTDRANPPDLPERFLVNLDEDPGERNNLAQTYPEKVRELEALYLAWKQSF